MEIPYIVTPRKDTGLFNSKIAIWLFLASEVMLFGGFFSAYVFLRLGADYPWPERALPVMPGLINTFVLIGSSVTVVFAWAALKMRQWRKFQIYMGLTIAAAALFMVFKGIEYNVKFHHQAVRLTDYTVVEGHLGTEKDEAGKEVLDYKGDKIEENQIVIEASKFTFSTVRYHKAWVQSIIDQAKHHHATIKLAADVEAVTELGKPKQVVAKAGEELSTDLLKKLYDLHHEAKSNNGSVRLVGLRKAWKKADAEHPGKSDVELAPGVNIDPKDLEGTLLDEIPNAAFNVEPPVHFLFRPRDVQEGATQSRLRDDTVVEGKMLASPMVFHNVDAVDFQHLVMKAKAKGIDPDAAIESSWIIKNDKFIAEVWQWHKEENAKKSEQLLKEHGIDKKTGKPRYYLTPKELYRIGWQEFARHGEEKLGVKISGTDRALEQFLGPNYKARTPQQEGAEHAAGHGAEHEAPGTFPHLSIPRENIRFAAKFTPAWNTYYAIYFTITGLHGLHVIGGAIVLGYYLFCGKKMYDTNPEWLANRVEVGGLFWHFVDLVWIFVFPILYLM